MNGIDIIKYYLYKNQNFVRRSLPSVEVVNRAVGKPDMVTASLAFVSELLKQWRVNQRKNLLEEEDVKLFLEALQKSGVQLEASDSDSIVFWLSYCLGSLCSNLAANELLAAMNDLYYRIDGAGFFCSVNPRKEVVEEMSQLVDCSTKRLLLRSRLSQTDEDTAAYIRWFMDLPEDSKMNIVNSASTYQTFNPLPDDCYMISGQLIDATCYRRWVEIFDEIQIPSFQVQWCMPIHEPDVFCEIVKVLEDSTIVKADKTRLKVLLLNEWFNCLVRAVENSIGTPSIDGAYLKADKIWRDVTEILMSGLPERIEHSLDIFRRVISDVVLGEVFFSKAVRSEVKNSRNDAFKIVFSLIQDRLVNILDIEKLKTDVDSISYLSFLAKLYVQKNVPEEKCLALVEKIFVWIKGEKHFFLLNLEATTLAILRPISVLLLHCKVDIERMWVDSFRTLYEGVNSLWINKWSERCRQECIALCIVLLTLEQDVLTENEKKARFDYVCSHLLRQCHCCGMDLIVRDDYKWPLILSELIADQILPAMKKRYEMEVVKMVFEKDVVLAVLSASRGPVATEAKMIIKDYWDKDWPIKKKKLANRKNVKEIKWMEELMEKVI